MQHTPAHRRSRLRMLVGPALILLWLVVLGVGGPFFGRISEVSTTQQSSFLPQTAESTQVSDRAEDFTEDPFLPAVAVAERDGQLTDEDQQWAQELTETLVDTGVAAEAPSPPVVSEDGQALQLFVPMDEDDFGDQVAELRTEIAETAPDGLRTAVTGPAGFASELAEGFAGIDGILLLVALVAVFVILVIVYRSPLLPIIVLITAVAALCAAIIVVYALASSGLIQINGQVQGILFILVVGAATDYSLLYTARYRDALHVHRSTRLATRVALRGTMEPVLASGGTVIAGLLCLLVSDLGSTAALGPAAATGIIFSMLAALTFLPAVLMLAGRAVFWPSRPRVEERGSASLRVVPDGDGLTVQGSGLWAGVGRFIARRHRPVWILSTVVLLAAAAFAPQLQASGLRQSETLIGASPAADGQQILSEHFPGGSGSPITVIAPESAAQRVAQEAEALEPVGSMTVTALDAPQGSLPLGSDAEALESWFDGGVPGANQLEGVEPTVVDGDVQIQITTTTDPDADETFTAVEQLRERLGAVDPGILVGGETASTLDANQAAERDRAVIIPMILVVVTLILMLLLRSILAPVLLVALTVISYASALGVGALVFNNVLDFPGSDPSVPLYAFVFLVALGIDYNIFLMSRVREESLVHGTRRGVLRGTVLTGGVITSAGIVLAATFAALAVIPIVFMVQLAFLVAFGVLLDALLVRSLLVPALTYDMGRIIWWPRHRRIAA